MARNGSGVYSLPAGYLAVTGATITAAQHNTPLQDIASDLNIARPQSAGGTGATSLGAGTVIASGSVTARALAARFGEVFNVKDYGATGDGSTDDRAAIQAAIDAAEVAGGVVYFPSAGYKISDALVVDADSVHLIGGGRGCTRLLLTNATSNWISIGAGSTQRTNLTVADMTLALSGISTKSSGAGIACDNVFGIKISDVEIRNPFIGMVFDDTTIARVLNCDIERPTVATGGGVAINGGNDQYFYAVVVSGEIDPATHCVYGYNVRKTAAAFFVKCGAILSGHGWLFTPQSGEEVTWCFFSQCHADSGTGDGYRFEPGAGGTVKGCEFVGCWSATNDGAGLVTVAGGGSIADIKFQAGRLYNNALNGATIAAGMGVKVQNCTIAGNSRGSTGTHHGVSVAAGVTRFQIDNNRIGDNASELGFGATQGFAVVVNAGGSDFYTITNNLCSDNVQATKVSDGGTGVNKTVSGNVG